jgi:hypothetical protein
MLGLREGKIFRMNRVLPRTVISSLFYQTLTKDSLIPVTLLRYSWRVKNSDLVVDGFPRSGTTYLTEAIRLDNLEIQIASHSHGHSLIKLGKFFKKQIYITYRNPIDSCASLIVRDGFDAKSSLKLYLSYYRYVLENQHHLSLVDFEKIVDDGVEQLLRKGGFSLSHDREIITQAVVNREIEFSGKASPTAVAVPHPDRYQLLLNAREEILKNPIMLAEASELYKKLKFYNSGALD